MNLFIETAWLLLPLLGGGIIHGLIMKYHWLDALAYPIDAGRSFRGVRWFGDNKTWRGPVALGLGCALVLGVQGLSASAGLHGRVYSVDIGVFSWFVAGFVVGFLAMIGELPNSFLKRRAGIQPGAGGEGRYAWFFYLYDQVDLLLFVAPVWWLLGAFTWPRLVLSLILVTVIHQLLSSIGYRLGMRKTPR